MKKLLFFIILFLGIAPCFHGHTFSITIAQKVYADDYGDEEDCDPGDRWGECYCNFFDPWSDCYIGDNGPTGAVNFNTDALADMKSLLSDTSVDHLTTINNTTYVVMSDGTLVNPTMLAEVDINSSPIVSHLLDDNICTFNFIQAPTDPGPPTADLNNIIQQITAGTPTTPTPVSPPTDCDNAAKAKTALQVPSVHAADSLIRINSDYSKEYGTEMNVSLMPTSTSTAPSYNTPVTPYISTSGSSQLHNYNPTFAFTPDGSQTNPSGITGTFTIGIPHGHADNSPPSWKDIIDMAVFDNTKVRQVGGTARTYWEANAWISAVTDNYTYVVNVQNWKTFMDAAGSFDSSQWDNYITTFVGEHPGQSLSATDQALGTLLSKLPGITISRAEVGTTDFKPVVISEQGHATTPGC